MDDEGHASLDRDQRNLSRSHRPVLLRDALQEISTLAHNEPGVSPIRKEVLPPKTRRATSRWTAH